MSSSRPLWKHQLNAIGLAGINRDLGLFFEQGTGKSRTTIEILRRKYASQNRVMRTLIFAPIIVCQNWKDEFAKFSKVQPRDVVTLTNAGKARVRDFVKAVGDDLKGGKIIVTNYEAVQMEDLYKLILAWKPEILVVDESQKCKSHTSKRAKLIVSIADMVEHRYILTGTPILNSPMDIFQQFRILDKGETFGKNFFGFRATYFSDANDRWKGKQSYFPKWQITPENLDRIQEKISKKAVRVLKSECLDLPPLIRQEYAVQLSKEQARMYKEMRDEYLAFIQKNKDEPRAVVAQLAITKALRLQQIVSGFVKDEHGQVHRMDCPRLEALSDLLEAITPGAKVIVWSVFKENYNMIAEVCKKLGIEWRAIHGDIPNNERVIGMQEFRENPNVRVMIANQAAGGAGVNLVEASYAIYYSKGFSLEQDLQSEARNHRGGSEMHDKVTRIDLVAKETIDDLITKALHDKQQIADRILTWNI